MKRLELKCWRVVPALPIWEPAAIRRQLEAAGQRIDAGALELIDELGGLDTARYPLTTTVVSAGELGFRRGASYLDICSRASTLGLAACPLSAGPALRLSYPEQADGEDLRVTNTTASRIFVVRRDGDRMSLSWDEAEAGSFWDAGRRFVFQIGHR